ncbi:hypothetical protein D9757_015124 [Collybiopsis confluens]|uniref:Uncharacterized protein n=1 Tax=Collybiopsis confluens TaxID=2823264 RepID=A0A8H5CBP6_9AGAR|nr:hypothetical protein D9757_015124 [Collybiopsis confluens]
MKEASVAVAVGFLGYIMTTGGVSLFIDVVASLRKPNKEGPDLAMDLLTLFLAVPSVFFSVAFLIFFVFGLLDVMFNINIYHRTLRFFEDRDSGLKKSHVRFTMNGVRILPGQLMWSASAFILAIISTGGSWTRNSTLANISGASNAIVTLLRGILDANHSSQSNTAPQWQDTRIIDSGANMMEAMENGNYSQSRSPNQNPTYSPLNTHFRKLKEKELGLNGVLRSSQSF